MVFILNNRTNFACKLRFLLKFACASMFQTINMEKGQKKAMFNFYGTLANSLAAYVYPKPGKNVRVKKIKVEACGKPESELDLRYKPRSEMTNFPGFRPGPTQVQPLKMARDLNFGFRQKRYCTINEAKNKGADRLQHS